MSRLQRYTNISAVVLPFVATLAAIVLLWNSAVGWTDLAIARRMYLVTALGITIGYHRMLTHRAFQTYKPLEYAFAAAGSMAVQGPVIDWVADHRKHHAHTDEEGDPHSPHVGHGSGLAGLWHAHVGWLFDSNGQADRRKYAPDLMDDRGMRLLNRRFSPSSGSRSGSRSRSAGCSPERSPARSPGCSGAASCGSSSSTTSPGRSTRSATSTAAGGSPPTTTRPTSGGSRSPPWARRGTTTTTPSRAPPSTACAAGSSTRPARSSALMQRLGLAWNVVRITPERQAQRLA